MNDLIVNFFSGHNIEFYASLRGTVIYLVPYKPYIYPKNCYTIDGYYGASNRAYHMTEKLIKILNGNGYKAERNKTEGLRGLCVEAGLGSLSASGFAACKPYGTFMFIGAFHSDAVLTPSLPPPAKCEKCNKCFSACPTSALGNNLNFCVRSIQTLLYKKPDQLDSLDFLSSNAQNAVSALPSIEQVDASSAISLENVLPSVSNEQRNTFPIENKKGQRLPAAAPHHGHSPVTLPVEQNSCKVFHIKQNSLAQILSKQKNINTIAANKERLIKKLGCRLLGCDICQRLCPMNAHIEPIPAPERLSSLLNKSSFADALNDKESLEYLANEIGHNIAVKSKLLPILAALQKRR